VARVQRLVFGIPAGATQTNLKRGSVEYANRPRFRFNWALA
jgi:hypothetical protein